ncbi:uncharacterized protein [Littorina saxatilis]|uniref:Uncharacterized protein n=1 Tax=Littorina saxatilis TaxID=31220 RepID=A0AAN9AP46_9CAEN
MATYAWLRRKAVVLVVMVLLDYSGVHSAPRPAISLQHVPATPGLTDAESIKLTGLEMDTVEKKQVMSQLENLLETVAYEETSASTSSQEADEQEFTRKAEHILGQREKMATDDLLSKTLHIMEDVSDYNSKVQNLGDVRELIIASCWEDVVSAVDDVLVNLGEDQDVMTVLTTVALLQLHQCHSAAIALTSRLLTAVEDQTSDHLMVPGHRGMDGTDSKPLSGSQSEDLNDNEKQHGPDASSHLDKVDFCSHLPECQNTGILTVRKELAEHPSLLVVYDVSVVAVFSQAHSGVMAKALVDDVTGELNITAPEADFDISDHAHISKRSSCVDKKEAKAQAVISWIPFLGTFYNLISSAVYAGKGCKDVAKQRAIEGTIDVVMDVATVVTVGTGAAAFQGAKALVKGGTKQVFKAAFKKTFKKVAKSMAKQTLKGYKNPIKGAIREVKDTVGSVISLVKAAPTLAKKSGHAIRNVARKLSKPGVKRVGDSSVQALGKSAAKNADVLDNARHGMKAPDDAHKGFRRCRRSPGCKRKTPSSSSQDSTIQDSLLDAVDNQFGKRGSPQVQGKHADRWDDLWNKYEIKDTNLLPHTLQDKLYKNIKGIDLTGSNLNNKELFQALQQKAVESSPLYVKQNLGGLDVEYITRRQPYRHSSDQIVITVGVAGPNGRPLFQQPATYADITRQLDRFANKFPDPVLKRQEMVDAMRRALYDPPNQNFGLNLKALLKNDPATQKAAREFLVITQLAEAVHGRNKGIDAYFRAGLKNIVEKDWTFFKLYKKVGVVTKPGSLRHGKKFFKGTNTAERMDALGRTGSDPDAVRDTVLEMSDPDRRRK